MPQFNDSSALLLSALLNNRGAYGQAPSDCPC